MMTAERKQVVSFRRRKQVESIKRRYYLCEALFSCVSDCQIVVVGVLMETSRRRGMVAATTWTALCLLCISLVDAATDQNDVSALNSMLTDFDNNARLLNWEQSAGDPCNNNWLGVTCDGPFVSSIELPRMELSGKVQGWVIQNLRHLSVLDLSQNNLDSQIPDLFPPELTDLNLSNNQFTGNFPYLLINIPSLISIKFNNNKLNGTLNGQIFSKLMNVTILDISNNGFAGPIPGSIGDMTNVQYLYLQNNKLIGSIPTTLSGLLLLNTLDVSNNLLTGYLPPNLNPPSFRYGGNPLSQQTAPPPPYTPPSPYTPHAAHAPPPPPSLKSPKPVTPPVVTSSPSSSSSKILVGSKMVALIVVVIFVLAATGIAVWLFVIRHRPERTKAAEMEANNNHSSRRSWFMPLIPSGKGTFEKGMERLKVKASPPVKTLHVQPKFTPKETVFKKKAVVEKVNRSSISGKAFSVADLQEATNNFSHRNLLGKGSLGCVYRAELLNGQVLAVKKLDTNASEEDFLGVVDGLARLQHTNVVDLMGFCVEHGQRLLVYEYISRGTLSDLLHGGLANISKGLSWNMRVKITLAAARALEYLHETCLPPVVHRNFKSANILLGDGLNPYISDCGLAALAPSSAECQLAAQKLSALGYSAPEYSMSGIFTAKSDVYSFGVVMLELLTGRKPIDSSRPRSEQSLVRWATPQLHDIDALTRMVDPALEGVYPIKSLSRFADIVTLCVQPEPEFRPPMSEVVQSLVRLMQRATLNKRQTDSNAGFSQMDIPDFDYSFSH